MSRNIVVLGATSAIGARISERLVARGDRLVITGRDRELIDRTAADLALRFRTAVHPLPFDARDLHGHDAFFGEILTHFEGELHGVVLCYGLLVHQKTAERDFDLLHRMIEVNYTSAVSLLNLAANYLEPKQRGFICALSSVAGDRGRAKNYLYGATKAALSTYLAGLRSRLSAAGVSVLTVKPGFVDTRMTWGTLNPASPLLATPDRVARDIVRAIDRKKAVVYTPWFWFWIMSVIKHIPEGLLRRLPV